jgi:hypothetical protein
MTFRVTIARQDPNEDYSPARGSYYDVILPDDVRHLMVEQVKEAVQRALVLFNRERLGRAREAHIERVRRGESGPRL